MSQDPSRHPAIADAAAPDTKEPPHEAAPVPPAQAHATPEAGKQNGSQSAQTDGAAPRRKRRRRRPLLLTQLRHTPEEIAKLFSDGVYPYKEKIRRGPYEQHPGGSQLFGNPEDIEGAEIVPRPDPLSEPGMDGSGMDVPGEPPIPADPLPELDESAFDMGPARQSTPLGRAVPAAEAADARPSHSPPVRQVSGMSPVVGFCMSASSPCSVEG